MKIKVNTAVLLVAIILTSCMPEVKPSSTATSTPVVIPTKTPTPTPTVTIMPTPKSWHWSNSLVTFNNMAVLPNKEVWAIGQHGTIIHDRLGVYHLENPFDYSGEYNFAGHGYLSGVSFISPSDGWLTAFGGQIFHWDGQEWTNVMPFGFENPVLLDIKFANENNGWVTGCNHDNNDAPVLMQWKDNSWKNISLSGEITNGYCLEDIDIVSETNVWIVGDKFQKGAIIHWDGTQWQNIDVPSEMKGGEAISVTSSSDVWVWDGEKIFYWNGSTWEYMELPVSFWYSENDSASPDVLALSQDNVWVGGRTLFHWNGHEWNNADYDTDFGYIVDIEVDSDGDIWALTLTGIILQLKNVEYGVP
jgi:hypothetical protein